MVGNTSAESPPHSIIRYTESLFAGSASNERKYWGFVIFQRALPRIKAADLQMLFTKNFMRTWINHLSHVDRYLHSFAKQIASTDTTSCNVRVC
jgi:DNA polymerase phi